MQWGNAQWSISSRTALRYGKPLSRISSFPALILYGRGISPLNLRFEFYANFLIAKCIHMALFAIAASYGLCATFRTILVIMRLVHKEPIDAQFLKRHNIVFPAGVVQLVELQLNGFLGALHLLDGKPLAVVLF